MSTDVDGGRERNVFESVKRARLILFTTIDVTHARVHLTFVLLSLTVPTICWKMLKLLKQRPRGILSMLRMRINGTVPEPGILAMTIHTWSMGKESKKFKPTCYVSAARGERVCNLFIPFLCYSGYPI